jgi:hypothetical protein
MLFISPMWDSENQRLGLKTCTPLGYTVYSIGELMGFVGLLLLVAVPGFLVVRLFRHQFSARDLWLLLIPLVVGVVGRFLLILGWKFATKRQFHYDCDTRKARWIENGNERVYPHEPCA